MPQSFASIATTAQSAQVRVVTWEALAIGGLPLSLWQRELDQAKQATMHIRRLVDWASWFSAAHCNNLLHAVRVASNVGASPQQVMKDLAGGAARPWPDAVARKVRKGFQREISVRLRRSLHYDAENGLRHRLSRWALERTPRVLAARAVRGFSALRSLVPPRVVAAVFSTIWNRWPTARRHQQRSGGANRCQLGCPGGAEDSIEHYSHCAALRDFASRRLNFHAPDGFLPFWCMVCDSDPKILTKSAIVAYAGYRATNTARHAGGLSSERAAEMLGQLLHDAVRGHREATAVASSCFIRRPRVG